MDVIPMYDPEKYDGKSYKDPALLIRCFTVHSISHITMWPCGTAIRAGGWMDIANKVPKLKQAIHGKSNDDQVSYWKFRMIISLSGFLHLDSPRHIGKNRRKSFLEEMNSFLSNVENSGKAFQLSPFSISSRTSMSADGRSM